MRRIWLVTLVLVGWSGIANAKAVEPPAELLASIAVAPEATLDSVRAYADAIRPGAGALLSQGLVWSTLAGLVGVLSLDGLDPQAWAYILVTDRRTPAGVLEPAAAIVAKVLDEPKLTASAGALRVVIKDHWAVIGPKPLVDKLASFALQLAAQPPPTAPSATIYLPQLLARYKTQIALARTAMLSSVASTNAGPMSKLTETYVDGLYSMASDTSRLIVTLDASAKLGSLDVTLVPKPGTRLAKFVALQKPSDYGLLDKLPPTTAPLLMAGHFENGPYRDGFISVWARMYGSDGWKDLAAPIADVMKATTGDLALAVQFGPSTGLAITQLFGISDRPAADTAIARLLALFKAGRTYDSSNVKTTIVARPTTTDYDGVTLHGYDATYDLSRLGADERKIVSAMLSPSGSHAQIATFDSVAAIALANDATGEAHRIIDAERGKGARFTAPRPIAELLEASRARKESFVTVIDLGGIMNLFAGRSTAGIQPMVFAMGFADHNAHLRLAVPAATVQAMLTLKP